MENEKISIRHLSTKIMNKEKISVSDKSALGELTKYLKKENKNRLLTTEFNDIEFLKFIQYLSKVKTTKRRYQISVAVRRLIAEEFHNGVVFTISPDEWPVPEKPRPTHFQPLSSEQIVKLEEFLREEIDVAYKKDEIFQSARKSGVVSNKIGIDFWHRANPEPELPRFTDWHESLKNAIATIYSIHPNFPNNASNEDLAENGKFYIPKDLTYTNLTTTFKTLAKRMVMQNIPGYTSFVLEAPELTYTKLISYIYPDLRELIAIKIAICFETGWSPDITERIDPDDYIYDPIPMENDWVFIKSTKAKGASVNKKTRLREQRLMIHPSSKTDKYSAYNLIKLLVKRTSTLRKGHLYEKATTDLDVHPAFISLVVNAGLKFVAHYPCRKGVNRSSSSKFIEKSIGYKLDLRRLRPTRLYLNEKEKKLPLLLQVALFGHSTSAITDEVYKDNSHFQQLRNDKLAMELDSIFDSIRDGSFKGKLVPLKQRTCIKKKIINIYTNHNGESPLAICNNPYYPTWHLSDGGQIPRSNKPCKQFNKCLTCQQSSVTSDNIPFVVDRFLYLDQKRRSMRSDQFDCMYREEYEAAKEVIESWPYQEDIQEAELRNAVDGYLLPPIISESN
ncbi:TPA: hypothetical protein ACN373_000832 [Vibrio parahaemolyticus]|nr:hypothetical protein ACS86_02165 [Vibrio alginolyticus]